MIKDVIKEAEDRMRASILALEDDLAGIRTGRASPALVEKLSVEYYGAPTPLVQLAAISIPEPRQILIKPFDISSVNDIERAIQVSDLGLTPNSDGKSIRLNLPPLTEDRRKELVRVVQGRVEEARIAVRNIRRDAIKDMREFENEKLISENDLKRGEDDTQKITAEYIEKINEICESKEKEVMEV
ncbi:MAG: ribosome recycling factor [Anaerolineales bacterium]|nr:MAG: ribosome recycling factor [Anaerolineales bacterium]